MHFSLKEGFCEKGGPETKELVYFSVHFGNLQTDND